MKIFELTKYLEDWMPSEIAWIKDNVGLQVGSLQNEIGNILICLDVNSRVIDEAIRQNCNLIISHHPLLFNPIKKIDIAKDTTSQIIQQLIKNNLTLISYHTNFDFTKDGVSFQLAKTIGLKNIKFLSHLIENQYKLVVFVPVDSVEKVSEAIFTSGGGIIGEYSNCSFQIQGNGTFKGTEESNPAIGMKGKFEKVNEIRLEVLVSQWKLNSVINNMLKVHPYEEPAFDIYPLKNKNVNYGEGAIGELSDELSTNSFLELISKKLKIKSLRYTSGKNDKIKKVAVCGGAGSALLNEAINNNADAFITADIKYHTFQDAQSKILLIDAGHFETEVVAIKELKTKINKFLTEKKINKKVLFVKENTNPIKYFNNY